MRNSGLRAFVLVALAIIPLQTGMGTGAVPKEAPQPMLPRLVDLGAGKCIPCKKMAPIIDELREDYAGIVDVVFIDVWKDPKAGRPYRIRAIPTQVFYDSTGTEVFRHVGFFAREDIETVFQEKLGVTPPAKPGKEATKTQSPEGPPR